MSFEDKIFSLSTRILELKDHINTEEGTKTALILPFLQALGYDTFDPRVVVPEYTADIGTKKGEKVDYAVKRDGEIIFLIEAKSAGTCLDASKAGQLHRYFHNALTTRIAILTDGIRYEFFSDLDKPNIMDERPFMVFDFANVEKALIPELKKLANDSFDVDVALAAAQDLKHLRQVKARIAAEISCPSDTLVRLLAAELHCGNWLASVVEQFRPKVKLAFEHYINDVLMERIQGVARPNVYPGVAEQETEEQDTQPGAVECVEDSGIVTTQEEIDAYLIVKAILCELVDPARIVMRDRQTYCGVLLDDNNRKPLCRFHFNSVSVKYLGTFDENKVETKHKIESLNDIFKFAGTLKATAGFYD